MKATAFCWMVLLLLAFPVSGKGAVLKNSVWVGNPGLYDREIGLQLSENGKTEDDPSTDDGEDLRDGDSDSNSNLDSDKDDG
jgi:hypothetical protein